MIVEIVRQTYIKGFYISTVLPKDTIGLYETMVFKTNSNNEVIDWTELYVNRFKTKEEAKINHNEVISIFEGENI
tara:strand:- start:2413 stop:2637 length:225 start_codon:yes stop_codon:yes gene_type:complete